MVFIRKSYAKVNIFLKITGFRDGYHQILSRFMRVDSLFDTITFIPVEDKSRSFRLEGFSDIPVEKNIITKAYHALYQATGNREILDYFSNHRVYVEKNIPAQAGLGGGSSNAGVFLNMANEICRLKLTKKELAKIGAELGADVPFFVYGFDSANISGFGEVVEKFDEKALDLEVFTPDIECNTAKVYQQYRKNSRDKIIDRSEFEDWSNLRSKDILEQIQEPEKLNDLFRPAIELCPKLLEFKSSGSFFSGSGSSFFKVKK